MTILQVFWYKVNRKKTLDKDLMDTPLRRCLTTFDLTLLGIGHMIGAGIFVLTGTVVRDIAGPGAILSYLFAGIAALLSSLCYAEFGARVPKAGSAYTYTYVTMGEFWAFIIGWNIILEYILGVASVARAFSGSFDALFNFAIRNGTLENIGHINVPMLSHYPDFIALIAILIVGGFVAVGAKVSVNFNSLFTIINLVVILLIITVGFSYSDNINWEDPGHGGFLPYGFQGTLAGAATCFYAYIGFDGIAIAGEEAKKPEKSIPIATCIAMAVVTVLYMLSSSSLTLLVPYFDVDVAAPFPMAFAERGLNWPKVVVAVGALFGITTSLTGHMFALPRAVYSMASDGLLFAIFAYVHPRTQTPLMGIIVFGVLAGVFALLIDINALVEFLSIGTLLSFTMVAAGVIILRYQTAINCQFQLQPEEQPVEPEEDPVSASDKKKILRSSQSHDEIGKLKKRFKEWPIIKNISPETTTSAAVIIMAVCQALFCVIVLLGYDYVAAGAWWAIILVILLFLGIIACFLILLLHEQNRSFVTFQMPLVPLLPSLSMFVNIAMMIKLSYLTWIRLAIWLVVGLVIYIFYGQRYSMENKPLSSYSQIVSYAGSTTSGPPNDQDPKNQDPNWDPKPEGESSGPRYDQAYEEFEADGQLNPVYEGNYQTEPPEEPPQQPYNGQAYAGYRYQGEPYEGQGYQRSPYEGHGYHGDGQNTYQGGGHQGYQGYQGEDYDGQRYDGDGGTHGYQATDAEERYRNANMGQDGYQGYQGQNYQGSPYKGENFTTKDGYSQLQGGQQQGNEFDDNRSGYNYGQDYPRQREFNAGDGYQQAPSYE